MLVLGIDHRSTDPATIAHLSRRADDVIVRLLREPAVRGVVVLATCARLEAYIDAASFHAPHRAFVEAVGVTSAAAVRSRRGVDALEHLFRVCSGLESAVIGETQITGQVRDSLRASRARGTSTRTLDLAFENALRVSRQARPHLRGSTSVAAAALDSLGVVGASAIDAALVIGTGSFAEACIAEVRARGARSVWVHSPSGRTHLPVGADCLVTSTELVDALALSDITITASGRGSVVIDEALAIEALASRSASLMLVDLACGDVANALDDNPDIVLLRLVDISRPGQSAIASACVRHEARAVYPRIEGTEVDDLIVALRRHIEKLASSGAGPGEDPAVADAVRRVTQALLHEPTQRARRAAADGDLDRYRAALEIVLGITTAQAEDRDIATEGSAA